MNEQKNSRFPHLFVVVRVDEGPVVGPVDEHISLVSAYGSRAEADVEVARLTDLAGVKPWRYVAMVTRLKSSE